MCLPKYISRNGKGADKILLTFLNAFKSFLRSYSAKRGMMSKEMMIDVDNQKWQTKLSRHRVETNTHLCPTPGEW